jgi:membrane protein
VRDILWTAIKAYGDDHAPQLAAAIAYHALFALAPLAVAVIAIGGLVFGSETMMQEATRFVGNAFGASSAETLKSIIASASAVPTTNVWATAGGGVLVLVGSARAFMQLQNGLNVVWGVRIRSRTSWYRVVLLRMLPFTLIVAGALIVAGVVIADALLGWALDAGIVASGIPGLGGYVRSAVWVLGSLAVIAYAYKVLPDARIRWQEVWLGSAITTALLALATLGFREYVARIGVGSALGVAGTPVVLIMWVYLASQIVLFGAEITQVVAHRRGQPIVPTSYAISVGEANDRV